MAVSVGSSGAPEKIARNLSLSGLSPLLDPHHIVSAAYVAKVLVCVNVCVAVCEHASAMCVCVQWCITLHEWSD